MSDDEDPHPNPHANTLRYVINGCAIVGLLFLAFFAVAFVGIVCAAPGACKFLN